MTILVIATAAQKEELLPGITSNESAISWHTKMPSSSTADAVVDLLFDSHPEKHFDLLKKMSAKLVVINDVCDVTDTLPANFIRINGWPTFLSLPVIEAYSGNEELKSIAGSIFSFFGKKIEWLPSMPGFVTARMISMIINEAYFANMENVSSKDEIDIAMKSGTNYPYGPFEWGNKIGLQRVCALLTKLEKKDAAYKPCELLLKEAMN